MAFSSEKMSVTPIYSATGPIHKVVVMQFQQCRNELLIHVRKQKWDYERERGIIVIKTAKPAEIMAFLATI